LEKGRYDVSKFLDTTYRGFLGVGTTFDIFQNILFPYSLNMAYWSIMDTTYWILFPSWSLIAFQVLAVPVNNGCETQLRSAPSSLCLLLMLLLQRITLYLESQSRNRSLFAAARNYQKVQKLKTGNLRWTICQESLPEFFENPITVMPNFILSKLGPGQEIELEVHAVKGMGFKSYRELIKLWDFDFRCGVIPYEVVMVVVGGVWRGKWGPLVAESGEGRWEEQMWGYTLRGGDGGSGGSVEREVGSTGGGEWRRSLGGAGNQFSYEYVANGSSNSI
nr:DNA-directed RNA polymerases I and III subunit RPAC1 [Tanacetum cinerariifolium]